MVFFFLIVHILSTFIIIPLMLLLFSIEIYEIRVLLAGSITIPYILYFFLLDNVKKSIAYRFLSVLFGFLYGKIVVLILLIFIILNSIELHLLIKDLELMNCIISNIIPDFILNLIPDWLSKFYKISVKYSIYIFYAFFAGLTLISFLKVKSSYSFVADVSKKLTKD